MRKEKQDKARKNYLMCRETKNFEFNFWTYCRIIFPISVKIIKKEQLQFNIFKSFLNQKIKILKTLNFRYDTEM